MFLCSDIGKDSAQRLCWMDRKKADKMTQSKHKQQKNTNVLYFYKSEVCCYLMSLTDLMVAAPAWGLTCGAVGNHSGEKWLWHTSAILRIFKKHLRHIKNIKKHLSHINNLGHIKNIKKK